MTYTAPGSRHLIQEVAYNAAGQTLTQNAEIDGVLVTPTGTPTAQLFLNGSDTAIGTPVVSGTLGNMVVTFSTTDTSLFIWDQTYRCVISFVSGGKTYLREIIFKVARIPTDDACPINLSDLLGMHDRIDGAITQTGQTSTAVARYLVTAWEEVRETLISQGVKVHSVNPMSLKMCTKYLAATNIAIGFLKAAGDAWTVVLAEWKERYQTSMARMVALSREADSLTVQASRGNSQPQLLVGNDLRMGNNYGSPFPLGSKPVGWPR